jgi:hypothetical protein
MPVEKGFGPIALLGSGETSLAGGRIFESIAQRIPQPLQIAILETPAGFELNSPRVAGRVGDFLKIRLQNFNPRIDIIPARKRGTNYSPNDSHILRPLLQASLIFMGPGSPTYAVRQLKGSLAWDLVRARHRQGAALVFASAAVIATGAYALPVYEIYKVGEEVSIVPGLDLFADFNLQLSLIPHWNNTNGGEEVDTSRCFIGIERFTQWCSLLPPGHTTIGLDEHTGFIIDFVAMKCFVSGVSSVTLSRVCNPEIFPAGADFSIMELGDFRPPITPEAGISDEAWNMVRNVADAAFLQDAPMEVIRLLKKRQKARRQQDWAQVDVLRQQIAALGWSVQDTTDGQKIVRQS